MNPERLYTVLVEPHFSEKVSILGEQSNQYGFKVATDATKQEIKTAVEQLFNVTVERVSTVNVKGKVKRTGYVVGKRKNTKRALVKLAVGDSIEIL